MRRWLVVPALLLALGGNEQPPSGPGMSAKQERVRAEEKTAAAREDSGKTPNGEAKPFD